MSCECSKLDWSEVDQTAEHHPLCAVEIQNGMAGLAAYATMTQPPMPNYCLKTSLSDYYFKVCLSFREPLDAEGKALLVRRIESAVEQSGVPSVVAIPLKP